MASLLGWVAVGLTLDDLEFLPVGLEVATWVAVWEVRTWSLTSRPGNPIVGRSEVVT